MKLKDVESGSSSPEAMRPMSKFMWKFMLVCGVTIYGCYTILVHLCEVDHKLPFSSASAVLLTEVCKLCMCVVLIAPEVRERGFPRVSVAFALPFSVPAVLYCLNNNLGIQMQLQMDPATYQVLSNLKILSTAFLYRIIIKKPITGVQWVALCMLAVAGGCNSYGGLQASPGESSAGVIHITVKGMLMICAYATISGLSGVYTEYILKDKYESSIHLQNGLLYIFGIILNGGTFIVGAWQSDDANAWDLLHGYSIYTWLLIFSQAAIGLIMSAIMKHGNNITRLFLISSAMVVTTVLSMLIFNLQLNVYFCASFVLVFLAIALYHNVIALPCVNAA